MPNARAAQLIEHLLARQQVLPILEKKTGLPYGWAVWLRALPPLAPPQQALAMLQALRPRAAADIGIAAQLPLLRAMRRLLWQGWDPAPHDQRWMRRGSGAISVLLHLMFFLLLAWVAVVRSPVAPESGEQGERTQIEFVGEGAQEGGGDRPGSASAVMAENASGGAAPGVPPSRAAARAVPAPASTPTAAAAPAPPTPAPASPPAAAPPSPPVQATEVAQATVDFVVPPVNVARTEVTVVPRAPALDVVERTVETAPAPPATARVQPLDVQAPALPTPDVQVREREVAPVLAVRQPVRLPQPTVTAPARAPEIQVREREIQAAPAPQIAMAEVRPRDTPPATTDRMMATPRVRERTVADAAPAAAPAPPASAAGAGPAAQAGPRPAPAPGNWATPARGDDWGAAARNRDGTAAAGAAPAGRAAGQGTGLFNSDGSVRVPGQAGAGDSGRGAPGGDNDGWSRERIAQSGTWLKRPPYDYTPTSFDKYWAPNESLLAEWVRRGVKSIEIPLPGTSSTISCVISVLQFGGGCGLSDPNMQEQPAIARPPPDVPFKPEYQDDNGSR
ncbi:ribonuclease E domain-containing protein [Xanthomonas sp. 60]